eukprot:scaffold2511_cov153-Skeletonema_menzelii.AAC.1
MKRSQSSKSHVVRQQQQHSNSPSRSIFPTNAGWGAFEPQQPPFSTTNRLDARAAAAGRSLLDRPTPTAISEQQTRGVSEHNEEFSASAADTPLPPILRSATEISLKSCLSSSSNTSMLQQSMHNMRRSRSSATDCIGAFVPNNDAAASSPAVDCKRNTSSN